MDWTGVVRWPGLCGQTAGNGSNSHQDVFWDYDNLMNTFSPDLAPCFQVSVLTWVTCGYLWVVLPFYITYLCTLRRHYQRGNKTKLNLCKIVLSVLLFGISLADLIRTITEETSTHHPALALYLDGGIRAGTFILTAVLAHVTYSLGIHSSGVLFCFWLLQILLNIVQFRSRILTVQDNQGEITDPYRFATFYALYGLSLISLCLECVADLRPLDGQEALGKETGEKTPLLGHKSKGKKKKKWQSSEPEIVPCPELKSTFPSLMTHWWITSYILRGYRKPLIFEDLPDILPHDNSTLTVDKFYDVWEKEALNKKKPSLIKALLGSAMGDFLLAALFRMIGCFMEFANPLLLQYVIGWVTSDDPYTWKGYVLATCLLLVNLVLAIVYHQFFKFSYISAYRMRTSVICAVYRKALRLSSAMRRTTTVGEIVNLMSVDAQKIHDVAFDVHEMWAAPLMMVLAMWMLWNAVGPSALAGLATLLLLAPLNGAVFARKYAKLQDEQMKHKDIRIKRTNELLSGIKVRYGNFRLDKRLRRDTGALWGQCRSLVPVLLNKTAARLTK